MWKAKSALGRWQADAIATVSDYSKKHIVSHFKLPKESVSVVGEAPDPVFRVLERPELSARLRSLGFDAQGHSVVYVGGFAPHKNLDRLIGAFAKATPQPGHSASRLFMVGEYKNQAFHSDFKSLRSQIDELGLDDRIVFTGYLCDEDLVALLNLTTVLVLPSLMEGFGLPALEAAACGCPVIATRESPLPEILGKGAIYIDPHNEKDLHSALERVLESSELRMKMSRSGLEAASRHTWESAAHQLLELIRELCRN